MQLLLGGAEPGASPTLIVAGIVMLAAFVDLLRARPRQGGEREYRIILIVLLWGGITVIVETVRQISN